jgi:hypothetical protein
MDWASVRAGSSSSSDVLSTMIYSSPTSLPSESAAAVGANASGDGTAEPEEQATVNVDKAEWAKAMRVVEAEAAATAALEAEAALETQPTAAAVDGGDGHSSPSLAAGVALEALRDDLSALANSQLLQRCRRLGVLDSDVDSCADAHSPKMAYIELILTHLRGTVEGARRRGPNSP